MNMYGLPRPRNRISPLDGIWNPEEHFKYGYNNRTFETLSNRISTYKGKSKDDTEESRDELFQLHQCARMGDTNLAETLLEKDCVKQTINQRDADDLTPLHYASIYNHFRIVQLLVKNGADVNAKGAKMQTPLHYACKMNDEEWNESPVRNPLDDGIIRFLIEHEASVTCVDKNDQTPLHKAASRGNKIACEQLLMYKTEVEPLIDARDRYNRTPLYTAVERKYLEITRLLVEAGADIHSDDIDWSGLILEAVQRDSIDIAKLIMNSCQDDHKLLTGLSSRDEFRNTPLMVAVKLGLYEFATILIDKGKQT